MSGEKRTCKVCEHDGGWHYDEDGKASRCPNYLSVEQHKSAQELAKLANANAWAAAQAIMRDVAETFPQFNANLIRDRFDQAGIPTSLRGSAFRWAAEKELIRKVGSVMSDQDTTRHEVGRWDSLVFARREAS